MNLREQAVVRIDRSLAELSDVVPSELPEEELWLHVREQAANLERFVKQLNLGLPQRATLDSAIKRLQARGLPRRDAGALHALRKAANEGKHDPLKTIALEDVLDLLRAAKVATEKIGVVGQANGATTEVPPLPPRQYAISVADYPTQGEVDYQIDALLTDGRTVHIDSYQARFQDETAIKEALARSGRLVENPRDDAVQAYLKRMRGSSELTMVWLFEGSLRDLASAFAAHQHSKALVYLQRQSDEQAVMVAASLAAIDVGPAELSSRPSALSDVMVDQYGVSTAAASAVADEVISMAACAGRQGMETLSGPLVLSASAFDRSIRGLPCIGEVGWLAVTVDGTLLIRGGRPYAPMP